MRLNGAGGIYARAGGARSTPKTEDIHALRTSLADWCANSGTSSALVLLSLKLGITELIPNAAVTVARDITPKSMGFGIYAEEAIMQQKEFESAMQDVAKVYGSPAELLADDGLTRQQKLKLLQQWDYDLGLLLVAAEENMAGPGSGVTSERLRNVREAIAKLGVESDPDAAQSPNKMGTASIPEEDTKEPKRKVSH